MIEPGRYQPSTYGENFADVYDEWYADISDVNATVDAIHTLAGNGSVLELGVGTGRLAIPLAAAGARVVGVDASPAMLAVLSAKPGSAGVVAIRGDMASLGDARQLVDHAPFQVVFAAFNTFFNLPTDAAQTGCMTRCHDLLAPGGRLILEGFVPPDDGLTDGGVSIREVTADAAVLTVSKHDADGQLIRGHHIEIRADGNTMRPWLIHYRTPRQLDASATETGFVLEQRWADWHTTPFDPTVHDSHISIYRKSSTS